MTFDKTQLSNMTPRQKILSIITLVILLIVIWQVIGLFKGGSKKPSPTTIANKNGNVKSAAPSTMPQPAQINTSRVQQPSALIKLQQETQEKYIAALNELQMLKISQQIAETNKDIAAAKLATVTAQKGVVDLLTKPAAPIETPSSFSPGLTGGVPGSTPQPIPGPTTSMPGGVPISAVSAIPGQPGLATYIVISVSQLLNRWNAVLGYQGKLYSISVGDVLPPDQSRVISIDKSGVLLEKDGVERKVSLVPII